MAPEDADKRAGFEAEALVHLGALRGLALRLTGGDEARSDDLVQEAVLRAYRAWERYEPGTNCRAWLSRILRNVFINEYRRREARPAPVPYDEAAEAPVFPRLSAGEDPEKSFFGGLVDRAVVEAIEALDEEFRVPLVLSDLEGLSYREVAEALDVPVGTVKSRLHRARRRLQNRLYEYAREMGYVR
ncbi:MAG TPA: sigma-70 family RNA polymerase sigma factor [Gemmatimonadota bacterium]|nr:sigma-70 family RNA polymerase sigma factor [Gemmatimonadota bacterium]